MKIPDSYRQRQRQESGQVLTEAAIGLSLLSLTWILLSFTSFMATNHIRTTMAARYAAWYQGESGQAPTTDQLQRYFFYNRLVGIDRTKPVGMLDLYADLQALDQMKLATGPQSDGPNRTTVSFGIRNLQSSDADQFPFVLLKTRLPFMPASTPDAPGILTVSSSCQWEETGEPWNEPKDALSFLWNQVKSLVKDAAKELQGAF